MAFEEVDIVVEVSGSAHTGVSVGLTKMRKSKAKMKVSIKSDAWETLGFSPDDRFVLLVGRDNDFGMIRLQKNKVGKIRVMDRVAAHGSRFLQLSLGHRPEFVDRAEKAVACQWEKIDFTTLEIVLPNWADETNPARKARIQAKPPSVLAADREAERQARELAEAEQRRRTIELHEVAEEAARQTRKLLSAPDVELRADLNLTPKERALLSALAAKKGAVVSKEALLHLTYGSSDDAPDVKILDVMICKIRPKLPLSVRIETRFGQGYVLIGAWKDLFEKAVA
ncbi:hypothetical protein RvVAT039_02390 [Agrobacterium vitis]|uniref:winged helix-turn-helix domain-containing protein n=1 Tax=Agrobacterium vitis TaxID=373 RepID=UPI0015D9DD7C|nr:helix-turn-helix domain-containing protein [Agrobacterium vitis]BCH63023.1 hypothetical protein RvVAT039_02390 [Agrobacterium vitis]